MMFLAALWVVLAAEMVAAVPPGSTVWADIAFRCWLSCDKHTTPQPRYSDYRAQRLTTVV